jgi:hypothetical protein
MTRLETVWEEQRGDQAMQPRNGKDSVIAVMLFVVALGTMAEVVVGRSSVPAAPRQASSWPVVLRAGDAARVRGDVPSARRAYLTALFRARGERSLVGVLGAAEGFQALGDREVVERALGMAAALGPDGGTASTNARLQALRDRLSAADARPMAVHVTR